MKAEIFKILFFTKKNTFFGRNCTPDTQILTFGPILKIRKFFDFGRFFHFFFDFLASPASKIAKSPRQACAQARASCRQKFSKFYFSRKKRFFRSKLYPRHLNFDIWTTFENSKFFRFWPIFSLFFDFLASPGSKIAKSPRRACAQARASCWQKFSKFYFSRKKRFFRSKLYTGHLNFDIWINFENSKKFDFGRNFHFFQLFRSPL